MEMGKTDRHISRHFDLFEIGNFALPIGIAERVFETHLQEIVDLAGAEEKVRQHGGKTDFRNAAMAQDLTQKIRPSLPRCDTGEMLRLLSGGLPLRKGEPGIARESHLAV